MSSIAPSLYFPPHAAAATPSTISPPPDNDVLIMRLLGQQIALQSHSHAVENCCCLGAPTPLCVSGRLTLASCWEQCSGTRAGALSLYNCSAAGETGAALCYEPHTGGGGRVGWGGISGLVSNNKGVVNLLTENGYKVGSRHRSVAEHNLLIY